jgi:hypothetical protein
MADTTLGTTEGSESAEPEEDNTEKTTQQSIPGIIWLPFIGAGIFAMVAQVAVNSDTRRQIRIGAILMMMLGLVMVGAVYNAQVVTEPEADTSQRTRAAILIPALDEGLAENEVLVAFHFPASFAPEVCTESGLYYAETGQSWQIESAPEGSYCIVVATIEIETGNTVEMVTMATLNNYQFNYEIESQTLGTFLWDVGDAEGDTDGRWWSYDLNGGYGMIGIAEQAIEPGDHIDWHFDAGQF